MNLINIFLDVHILIPEYIPLYYLPAVIVIVQTTRPMVSDVPSQSSMNFYPSDGVQLDRIPFLLISAPYTLP